MRLNGFDSIAGIYDVLAKLVYGPSIQHAQTHFLPIASNCTSILILGGGTGWLLRHIREVNATAHIVYVDASSAMLNRARRYATTNIDFIHGTEENIPVNGRFDLIVTPFYLDLFDDDKLTDVVNMIKKVIVPGSYWLATDFVHTSTWWGTMLEKVMYLFFRSICHIESTRLPAWEDIMKCAGFEMQDSASFYRGFIKTVWYRGSVE
ncbi:MAG TPA: class I SAM-dependent methyltransferase [Cyclobacteriaceae bacterium]|nr:class I SAM-dependent methyltransferase [Cyclobacteriaceae bacterium]